MRYVAFIGSRDLSQFSAEQLTLYKSTVLACVQHGHAVVTGACKGADQLAAETALAAGGRVLLVLPHIGYEWGWCAWAVETYGKQHVKVEVYDPAVHQKWAESVRLYHPAFARLGETGIQMHARNYGIVGRAIAVVALPNYQKNGGGTAQGLRVADALQIKVYDLRQPLVCEVLWAQLGRPEVAEARHREDERLAELDRKLLKAPSAPAQPRAGAENSSA